MEDELNILVPELLRSIGLTIKTVQPQDFLAHARAQGSGCTIIETVRIDVAELPEDWDVLDMAMGLVKKLGMRVLGNEILFFDRTAIVRYNVTSASCQLLLPHGLRIDRYEL